MIAVKISLRARRGETVAVYFAKARDDAQDTGAPPMTAQRDEAISAYRKRWKAARQ
jgi:hypothetical protein